MEREKIIKDLKKKLENKLKSLEEKLDKLERELPLQVATSEIIETSEDIERIKLAIDILEKSKDEIDEGFESAKRYAIHVLSTT